MEDRKINISCISVEQIKKEIETLNINELKKILSELYLDNRKSVQKLAIQIEKKISRYHSQIEEMESLYNMQEYYKNTYKADCVLCIDEVGRGPLAGPVTVAGVVLENNPYILDVKDSKKLTSKKRNLIFKQVEQKKIFYAYQNINSRHIDEINILNATLYAMKKLIFKCEKKLNKKIDLVLIDGDKTIKGISNNQVAIEKGDNTIYGIALASIIAKVIRDSYMDKLDQIYPGYNLKNNKGYGTKEHIDAIKKLGATLIHRQTFIKNFI